MKEFGYREIAEPVEQEGIVVKRDLMLQIGNDDFSLSIATPQYINELREYNKQFNEELQLDENILAIDSVDDLDEVVKKLSQMSWEIVFPYLVKQDSTSD